MDYDNDVACAEPAYYREQGMEQKSYANPQMGYAAVNMGINKISGGAQDGVRNAVLSAPNLIIATLNRLDQIHQEMNEALERLDKFNDRNIGSSPEPTGSEKGLPQPSGQLHSLMSSVGNLGDKIRKLNYALNRLEEIG